ncbi:hypothetical protein JCM10207_001378 [Rhodosporidiobolus poonsookiae]
MPLLFPSDPQSPQAVLSQVPSSASPSSPHYLVFFSSLDDTTGKPWCPDCADVQGTVDKLVPEKQSTLVFVGSRQEWKTPDNPFRAAPFNVSKIPTIIRVEQGGDSLASSLESAPRLVEADLRDESKFSQFVQ